MQEFEAKWAAKTPGGEEMLVLKYFGVIQLEEPRVGAQLPPGRGPLGLEAGWASGPAGPSCGERAPGGKGRGPGDATSGTDGEPGRWSPGPDEATR